MKRYAKILISLLYFVGLEILEWPRRLFGRSPQRLVILYYHAVPKEKRTRFTQQLNMLSRRANVVPANWRGEEDLAHPAVAITFDDAFVSVMDNALPELAERGFPATIFVPSGVLGRKPDWAMETESDGDEVVIDENRLKTLRNPMIMIGAHSVTHPKLTEIGADRARKEIGGSRSALEGLLGQRITLFAFPYGDHNEEIVEICRQEGYELVFSIVPERIDPHAERLVRGRVTVDPDDSSIEFFLKMSGAYAWMPLASKMKRALMSLGPVRSALRRGPA